jgi:uroporphyrinogen-III synthase
MTTEDSSRMIRCLVTRPEHQAAGLSRSLQQHRFEPLLFPTIEIEAAPLNDFLEHLDTHIASYDVLLFVSRNAVDYCFHFLNGDVLPSHVQVGVIGSGTLAALHLHGHSTLIIPKGDFNSEGLLAASALQQVEGKRVLIFRGQEGRNLLGDTLRERGASVDYCEVYRRALPKNARQRYQNMVEANGAPEVAVFTSSEGMRNSFNILDQSQCQQLLEIPWLLISERMRETATDLGHNEDIIIAKSASDEGLLQALINWRQPVDKTRI